MNDIDRLLNTADNTDIVGINVTTYADIEQIIKEWGREAKTPWDIEWLVEERRNDPKYSKSDIEDYRKFLIAFQVISEYTLKKLNKNGK